MAGRKCSTLVGMYLVFSLLGNLLYRLVAWCDVTKGFSGGLWDRLSNDLTRGKEEDSHEN